MNQFALVTGASRGIGAAIAQRLAREGYHVFLNYLRGEEQAQEVRKAIQEAGGHAELCPFAISDPKAVEEKFEWIHKNYGHLSVLVNNAGINRDALLLRLKAQDLHDILDIDLKGAIFCTQAAARGMLRAKKGNIIQIASVVGEMGNAGQSAYSAAKAGLIGFSKSIARELATRQIRVNVVSPGYIQTEMTQSLNEAQREAILSSIPLGSLGHPDDVASLVAYLASPESRYITGQVIGINGGMYI